MLLHHRCHPPQSSKRWRTVCISNGKRTSTSNSSSSSRLLDHQHHCIVVLFVKWCYFCSYWHLNAVCTLYKEFSYTVFVAAGFLDKRVFSEAGPVDIIICCESSYITETCEFVVSNFIFYLKKTYLMLTLIVIFKKLWKLYGICSIFPQAAQFCYWIEMQVLALYLWSKTLMHDTMLPVGTVVWCWYCGMAKAFDGDEFVVGFLSLVPARLPRPHTIQCVRAWCAVAW